MRNNLIEARKSKGYTLKDMADKLFITVAAYDHYERGRRAGSIENWLELERIFEIPINVLFTNDEETTAGSAATPTAVTQEKENMI